MKIVKLALSPAQQRSKCANHHQETILVFVVINKILKELSRAKILRSAVTKLVYLSTSIILAHTKSSNAALKRKQSG
jgi:hypothetical protein